MINKYLEIMFKSQLEIEYLQKRLTQAKNHLTNLYITNNDKLTKLESYKEQYVNTINSINFDEDKDVYITKKSLLNYIIAQMNYLKTLISFNYSLIYEYENEIKEIENFINFYKNTIEKCNLLRETDEQKVFEKIKAQA